ncbi:MAG: response regulator, partial [Tumebacillaceae bacterium]
AVNGLDAFHAYEKHKPDLVTMDVTMPVMDGIQAVKKIISEYPEAKIVVISAFDQRTMLFEAMEHGAKHYIIKPITAEKLLTVIAQILQQAEFEAASEPEPQPAPDAMAVPQEEAPATLAIENLNGTFHIDMQGQTDSRHLDALQGAVQGLLFIKPLNIVFRFGDHDRFAEEGLARLAEIIDTVQRAGGSVGLETANEALLNALRNRQNAVR